MSELVDHDSSVTGDHSEYGDAGHPSSTSSISSHSTSPTGTYRPYRSQDELAEQNPTSKPSFVPAPSPPPFPIHAATQNQPSTTTRSNATEDPFNRSRSSSQRREEEIEHKQQKNLNPTFQASNPTSSSSSSSYFPLTAAVTAIDVSQPSQSDVPQSRPPFSHSPSPSDLHSSTFSSSHLDANRLPTDSRLNDETMPSPSQEYLDAYSQSVAQGKEWTPSYVRGYRPTHPTNVTGASDSINFSPTPTQLNLTSTSTSIPTQQPQHPHTSFTSDRSSLSQRLSPSLRSRVDRHRQRSTELAGSNEAIRTRLGQEQALIDEIERLKKVHQMELQNKDKKYAYEQEDLLQAFQQDKAESEQQLRATIKSLRMELATTEQNLHAHQSMYVDYSNKIQLELKALNQEVAEQDERAHAQAARIAQLEQGGEADTAARQKFEAELIQQSNGVLLLKQEAFEAERAEYQKTLQSLTTQLEQQTQARVDFERKYEEAERKRTLADRQLTQLESAGPETEAILIEQRKLNAEMTSAYAQQERMYQDSQREVQHLLAQLNRAEYEYKQLEGMYGSTSHETGGRIQQLQLECNQLHDTIDHDREQISKLNRDLKSAHEDRLALHHTFIKLRTKERLQKLFCHWICITQARKFRNREMCLILAESLRRTKHATLHHWLNQAKLIAQANRTAKQLQLFHSQYGFQPTNNLAASYRGQNDPPSTPSSMTTVDIERGKKVELFHLLQRERTQWNELKANYEQQLHACETARIQEQQEVAEARRALAQLRAEHHQLQLEMQRKLQTDSAIQRAIHDTIISETPMNNKQASSAYPTNLSASTPASSYSTRQMNGFNQFPPPATTNEYDYLYGTPSTHSSYVHDPPTRSRSRSTTRPSSSSRLHSPTVSSIKKQKQVTPSSTAQTRLRSQSPKATGQRTRKTAHFY